VLAEAPVDPKAAFASVRGSAEIEARAGAIYDLIKRFRAVDRACSDQIRRLVKSGVIVESRDGVLEIVEQTYETLSKKSTLEALGQQRGERELRRLRKLGAVRQATREMLVPKR